VTTAILIAEVADQVSYSRDEERVRHHPSPFSGSDTTHALLHSNLGFSTTINDSSEGLVIGEDSDSVHLQEESGQERARRMSFTQ